jgi:aminobenzoyl-glutamate utilization protein B
MAGTAMEALKSPDLVASAKADHRKRTGGQPYQCPIPADVQPPITPKPKG